MINSIKAELAASASKLEARGTKLRPPATDLAMARLEATIGGPLGKEPRALFSVFDGFADAMADEETMVCFWSIDWIIHNIKTTGVAEKGQMIGDYFLSADLFYCDLKMNTAKIWWNERRIVAANSLIDFFKQVAAGTFEP